MQYCLYLINMDAHRDWVRSNEYVEAMHFGLAVIIFQNDTNGYTTEGKALFFATAAELEHCLSQLDDQRIAQLAAEMKSIADRRYTWPIIIGKYEACYG